MNVPRLSKSKYLSGLQCLKRLYLEIHARELASEMDEGTQAVLDTGARVGELARERYPGGVLVDVEYFKVEEGIDRTAAILADPAVAVLYEGFIAFDDVVVRPDVLVRTRGNRWRLIEVKSTSRVKDEHLHDLAIQAYVLRGAGLTLGAASLMHINTRYLYPGGCLDLQQLFQEEKMTREVADHQKDIPVRLAEMRQTLASPTPPVIEPNDRCSDPYECPFWDHCTNDKPARWIYTLFREKRSTAKTPRSLIFQDCAFKTEKPDGPLWCVSVAHPAPPFGPFHLMFLAPWRFKNFALRYNLPGSRRVYQDLVALGVQTIEGIPAGYPLPLIQQRVRDNVEWIGPRLRAALETIQYPVHHLDFETLGSAIPLYPNTRPYQAIPFQWSNHIEAADGQVRHEAYLCPDERDPREDLAAALLKSLGRKGSICTYTGYERSVLTDLAAALPRVRRDLLRVCDRLWNLHPIIKAHYYHPGFAGSYSIKSVLPAVVPRLAYDDLEIQEGTMASLQFHRMIFENVDAAEKARIRTALLKYCERDTLAMVELRRALYKKACR